MSLFERLKRRTEGASRPAAGQAWIGPLTFTTDPEIGRPGYYALEADGRTLIDPPLLLTHVNVDPTNEDDTRDVYLVADPDQPYHITLPPHLNPPNIVDLESQVHGTSEVTTGG